ncbi:hypothetical protein RIF29_25550 [Crotalaria pallida]|uniref:Uncharacterized protein n=1 Tax=Crotalaria pallida TaxID=3830 RepID=A0AAN9HZD7_CROPI
MQTSEINPLEEKASTISLFDDELCPRRANMADLWRTLNIKTSLARQISRARWIKEKGDPTRMVYIYMPNPSGPLKHLIIIIFPFFVF